MKKSSVKTIFVTALFTTLTLFQCAAQKSSLIVLGDLHYDLPENHEMEWLKDKPGDLRQINEYTAITRENWNDFMSVIREKAESEQPQIKAVVQVGDFSEGLAGSAEKAREMAADVITAIDKTHIPVPWIIAKGNHDITGPGAEEAFQEYYVPLFRKQTGNPAINNASYSYSSGSIQIVCIDPWDKETDMAAFLESEFSKSHARFKFVAVHEPVIPVTERCWHILRNDEAKREKLLEVIAKNKAIVLCGHLHRYSVVRRNTPYGPIVQVMVISVVRDRNYIMPGKVIEAYGPSLAENVPEWQPETLEARKAMLMEEEKFVTYYHQTDLPGYAVIKTDATHSTVQLSYYAAFAGKPYETVDLFKLLN